MTLSPRGKARGEAWQDGILGRGRVTKHPGFPGTEGLPGMQDFTAKTKIFPNEP